MKIVIFEFEEWERSYFDELINQHDVAFEERALDHNIIDQYQDADIISCFVNSNLHLDNLTQFKNLKFIATRSTGFDHIDIEYCKSHDIAVSNVPLYGEQTVAEHVFALLLAISHKIPKAIEQTRNGNFSQDGLQGFDLSGKTIGIIGTGHIGLKTIRIANGFGMNVIAYDAQRKQSAADQIGFEYVEKEDLFRQSDIISLHIPSNKHTHHFISTEEFELMKQGVVIINTARGDVLDIKALLKALSNGIVSAAGLDVLPEEPVIREEAELLRSLFTKDHDLEDILAGHILLHLHNVIITPHSAFNTKEAIERIIKTTISNINGFCANKLINTTT